MKCTKLHKLVTMLGCGLLFSGNAFAYKEAWIEIMNLSERNIPYDYICSGLSMSSNNNTEKNVVIGINKLTPQSADGTSGHGVINGLSTSTIKMNTNSGFWDQSPGCLLRVDDRDVTGTFGFLYFKNGFNSPNRRYVDYWFLRNQTDFDYIYYEYWAQVINKDGNDWYYEQPFKIAVDPYDQIDPQLVYTTYGHYKFYRLK